MSDYFGVSAGLPLAFIASAITAIATTLGALPALAARRISDRVQDILMGFSAGIMLAAACFALINPALSLAAGLFTSKPMSGVVVAVFILVGGAFLHLCNKLIPHEHFIKGREGGLSGVRLKRIWLFVFAIALHNFPEGLAVGTGVGSMDPDLAMPILVGIALQDIPEGFVVAIALLGAGYSIRQSVLVTLVTGLIEASAALIGYFGTVQVQSLLPWALAFAGGSMLYVISDEMIPESHRKEFAREATAGLMVGFVLMMVLDVTLS